MKKGEAKVRQGGPSDVDPAVAVCRAADAARLGGDQSPQMPGDRLRDRLRNPEAFLFVVDAGDSGEVLGMAAGTPGLANDGAGPPIEGLCHVGAVFVAPDHWGEGLGGMLVDAVLAEARSRGYDRAQLWTHAGNVCAHRLYQGRGFSPTGREKEDDHGETITHYVRNL